MAAPWENNLGLCLDQPRQLSTPEPLMASTKLDNENQSFFACAAAQVQLWIPVQSLVELTSCQSGPGLGLQREADQFNLALVAERPQDVASP